MREREVDLVSFLLDIMRCDSPIREEPIEKHSCSWHWLLVYTTTVLVLCLVQKCSMRRKLRGLQQDGRRSSGDRVLYTLTEWGVDPWGGESKIIQVSTMWDYAFLQGCSGGRFSEGCPLGTQVWRSTSQVNCLWHTPRLRRCPQTAGRPPDWRGRSNRSALYCSRQRPPWLSVDK